MAQPLHISASLPDANLFNWPPTSHPAPLPPVSSPSTVMHPFNIPDTLFVNALDPRVPLTIAAAYAVTVKLLNKYNKANGKKAWWISKTRPFFAFVVLHNVFLAVYSAWTFWGMLGGMRRSWVGPFSGQGSSGTADMLCRLHGEAGVGNSVFYDDETSSWMSLASDGGAMVNGIPSNTTPGRIWNEGLAYYGWLFYLSKFYEVLDTFIILAKGKPSSTLQTFHHSGAMLCMWAGVRYMSVPIWVFVQVNSFIHALMYTYYTLTAFSIKIPNVMKRTLTTMQITQFLVGASYAMIHSFISYTVPITVTTSSSTTDAAEAASPIRAIKNAVFGSSPSPSNAPTTSSTETVYITQPCISTAGETFAIWLNVLYLAPLTYLFVSFFIASYVKRANKATSGQDNVMLAEKAGWDAARGVEREIYNGENMVNGHVTPGARTPVKGSPVGGSPNGSMKKKGGRKGKN